MKQCTERDFSKSSQSLSLFSRIQHMYIYIAIYCVQFVYTCLSNYRHIHITHPTPPMVRVPLGVDRTGSQFVNHVRWEWRPSQGAALWWRGAIILPAWIILMFLWVEKKTIEKICPGCSVVISRWCFQIYFVFSPRNLEKWSNLTHVFYMGWFNHQLDMISVLAHLDPFWVVQFLSSWRM